MEILVTLTVQKTIKASTEKGYESKRQRMIEALERKGFTVNLDSEDGDEDDGEYFD